MICPANHMPKRPSRRAFTLIEISMCLGLIVALSVMAVMSAGIFGQMNSERKAEATLRQIDNARQSYLVDHPDLSYSDLSLSTLSSYMASPSSVAELPSLGYSLTDADIQHYPLTYGIVTKGSLPIKAFSLR